MNKILKYGLFSIGAILVIFIALIALVAATFNPNDYKPLIIKLVQEKKQRTLNLEGEIKLTFFPSIGADLGKLSLSEHNGSKEFAAVDSVRVSLAVLPLLKKQLVVDHIRIDGIRVGLVRYADGSTSIDDLLKKEEESEQFKFDIKGVSVNHAALAIDDQMARRKLDISGLEFESGRLANNQPGKVDLKFSLQNNNPKVDAKVALVSGLLFDLDTKAISLEKLSFSMAGKVGADNLEVRLTSPKFELGPESVAGKLDLAVKMVQPNGHLDLALSVPALSGKGSLFKADNFVLVINGKQGDKIIKSQIASPFSANLESRQFSLDKLAASLNLSGPSMAKPLSANLNGAARLDLAKQKVHLDLSGKLDESQIKTRLGMSNFDAPAYDFDIAIDQLDVDSYLPPAKPAAKSTTPESPLDFGFLKGLNTTGQLSMGALKVSNIKFSSIKLNVKAGGGNLNVVPISANLYQGSLNGALSLHDAAIPRVVLKQNLVGINVNPLLKDAASFDMLEGRGNIALDVNAQGSTASAMKKALQGSASFALRDGAIKGVNIAGAIKSAKAKFGSPQGTTTQAANAADKTEFSELTASFQIKNGVAHNEDLAAKSPLLRLAGNGDVNLGESSMNYLAKATVVASLEGQGGKDLSSLKGMTVPVRISGPFSGLKYSLDFNAMASEAVKQKVEQKKDELKSRLGEQLKGGLKGLFK